jgi:hypothetical protein
MDWTTLQVDGRVTAMRHGLAAGVGDDGDAFVVPLRLPHPEPMHYDGLVLDSFGVLGVAPGEQTWLTGRGADGRLHLWSAYVDGSMFVPHSLDSVEAMWAAPVVDGAGGWVLASRLEAGTWRLRVFDRESAVLGGRSLGEDLVLGGSPDAALAYGPADHGPLVVAGALGEAGTVSAWALASVDTGPGREPGTEWRRVHLMPAPTDLCSVAAAADGRHTWVAGHVDGRLSVHAVLPLPFRGPVRSAVVSLPPVDLVTDGPGGLPVVLVDDVPGPLPWFVAATVRGLRLCWHDGSEWKAHPVPDGRLRGATFHDGAVHVWLDGTVWSLPAPS